MSQRTILLMSPPDFYRIKEPGKNGHSNKFCIEGYKEYSKDKEAFKKEAYRQWSKLKDIFEEAGAEIILLTANKETPAIIYTADLFIPIIDGDKRNIVISKFSNPNRLKEAEAAEDFIKAKFPNAHIVNSDLYIEGTGDNVYDPYRDIFWSGYDPHGATLENASTGRSDINAHKTLEEATSVEVVSVAVKEPFFHIDTALCPLPNGHILFYKAGIQEDMLDKFYKTAFDKYNLDKTEYLIEVTKEDAKKFGCNARIITNAESEHTIVMAEISDGLKSTIESKGYKVVTTALDKFIADGGAAHCLSNNLNEIRKKHD